MEQEKEKNEEEKPRKGNRIRMEEGKGAGGAEEEEDRRETGKVFLIKENGKSLITVLGVMLTHLLECC